MSDDLERDLAGLYRPVPAPEQGLAAVKRRGDRIRRRRRTSQAALASVVVVAGAVSLATLPAGHHRSTIDVGTPSTTTTTTAAPTTTSTVGFGGSASGEPQYFVEESASDHITVVDSTTGLTIRQLTPVAHDIDGVLSPDGKTVYVDADFGALKPPEPHCPDGQCAITVATGATRALPVFSWGASTPGYAAISPDGTREAALTTGSAPTVRIARTTGAPTTRSVPEGLHAIFQGPTWSPDDAWLDVGTIAAVSGQHPSEEAIVDVATGRTTLVRTPAGCFDEGSAALSDGTLFEIDNCGSSQAFRITPYDLSTGKAQAPISSPSSEAKSVLDNLGADPSGKWLIVSFGQSMWTHHDGVWTRIPKASGVAPSW